MSSTQIPGPKDGGATLAGLPCDRREELPQVEAIVRRLVACWNACEGVPTDHLETMPEYGGAIHAMHTRMQAMVDTLAATETYLDERVSAQTGSTGATKILPMIRRAIEGAGVAPTQSTWADC